MIKIRGVYGTCVHTDVQNEDRLSFVWVTTGKDWETVSKAPTPHPCPKNKERSDEAQEPQEPEA